MLKVTGMADTLWGMSLQRVVSYPEDIVKQTVQGPQRQGLMKSSCLQTCYFQNLISPAWHSTSTPQNIEWSRQSWGTEI
jgi:hypothetical protein